MMEPSSISALQAWALVPIKAPCLAKSRLSGLFSVEQRARLQWAMLQDVLDQLSRAKGLRGIAVVSPDLQIRRMAQARGMLAFGDDPKGGGLNGAVHFGSERLRNAGADLIAILPGDVPTLDFTDIDRAIDMAVAEDTTVVVPDRDLQGTNALVFWADRPPVFRFGKDSFYRHLEALAGRRVKPLTLASIARDIDCPADIDHLRSRWHEGLAPRTNNALTGFGLVPATDASEGRQ